MAEKKSALQEQSEGFIVVAIQLMLAMLEEGVYFSLPENLRNLLMTAVDAGEGWIAAYLLDQAGLE